MSRFRYKRNSKYEAAFDPERCAEAVSNDHGCGFHQCARKHLKDEDWCKQHSPEDEVRRGRAATARRREYVRTDPRARAFRRSKAYTELRAAVDLVLRCHAADTVVPFVTLQRIVKEHGDDPADRMPDGA